MLLVFLLLDFRQRGRPRRLPAQKIMKYSAPCHQCDRPCHAYNSEDICTRMNPNRPAKKSDKVLVCPATDRFCPPIQGEDYDQQSSSSISGSDPCRPSDTLCRAINGERNDFSITHNPINSRPARVLFGPAQRELNQSAISEKSEPTQAHARSREAKRG